MSDKQTLLLNAVLRRLDRAPSGLLKDLSREMGVSRRTLQKVVSTAKGKTFREVREEMLVEQVKSLLESHPTRAIKELAFELGYKSPRSFARAIKRVCGSSPAELRSRTIFQLLQLQKGIRFED
ncbi:MAG: hypothetical protein DMG38_09025 [Acidobacteria bacterium]|nr:MAG: hypothetical protein DMG38_09025 [Acidobacteriota bacterium]